jgi:hypothetical protein
MLIDEFSKSMEPVKNMLHPLLEVNNPRLGDVSLPEGSIVFMTGNLTSDGVGDTLKAHTKSRITTLHVKKPDSEQWLRWAVSSGKIDPVVMAWVDRFPHALASYTDDGQSENPYIYQPKKMQDSYVTPRSLELASNIIAKRSEFDDASLIAALSGTIGEAGGNEETELGTFAHQLHAFRPARDDAVQREVDGLIALVGAVKLRAAEERAAVVNAHGVGGLGALACSGGQNEVLQTAGGRDDAFFFAVFFEKLFTFGECDIRHEMWGLGLIQRLPRCGDSSNRSTSLAGMSFGASVANFHVQNEE